MSNVYSVAVFKFVITLELLVNEQRLCNAGAKKTRDIFIFLIQLNGLFRKYEM